MNAMTTIRRTGRMLGAEEELALHRRHVDGDRRATHDLVEAHMPLINKVAGRYSGFGRNHGELVQEGSVGFIQGLNHFDPALGYRINTLCRWWIRAAVTDWVRNNHSLIKLGTTAAQKKAFGSLKAAKARLGIYDEGALTQVEVSRLAKDIGIDEAEVYEMNTRLSPLAITSLDTPMQGRDGGDGGTRVDHLADPHAHPEDFEDALDDARRSTALHVALERLDPRRRDIIRRRYLDDDGATLAELADVYGVSRERIRQLEVQGIEELGLSLPAALSNMAGQERRTARRSWRGGEQRL